MNILYQKPFFTDGSKTEEEVAAAAVSTKRIKKPFTCRLPDDSSIYELRAILLALKHVYYSKVKSFLILSGSLSSLESILKLRCINWVQGEVVKKNEPGRLGTTQCEFVPTCLVKWVPHWNTLHTTKTSQTGQATSSLQRPLDQSTSGWLLLLFLYIPDVASPSNCCTLEQTIPG